MIPIVQTVYGRKGNCFKAAMASIFEIEDDLDTLPRNHGSGWEDEWVDWLQQFGLTMLCIKTSSGTRYLKDVYWVGTFRCKPTLKHPWPTYHAVVMLGDEIVWNPQGFGLPHDWGLEKPVHNGWYFIVQDPGTRTRTPIVR